MFKEIARGILDYQSKKRPLAGSVVVPSFARYKDVDGSIIQNTGHHIRTNSLSTIIKSKGLTEAFKVDVE